MTETVADDFGTATRGWWEPGQEKAAANIPLEPVFEAVVERPGSCPITHVKWQPSAWTVIRVVPRAHSLVPSGTGLIFLEV